METTENQRRIIWKAINHWMRQYNLSPRTFSSQISGISPPYLTERILKGITYGSEPITSDLLHECVRVFGLAKARQKKLNDNLLTDDDCIALLTAPVIQNEGQSEFKI
jgi:hypothetical protein